MIKNIGGKFRMPEVGKIKIGGKGEERTARDGKKWRMPVRFDYFLVTTTERGAEGNFLPDEQVMAELRLMAKLKQGEKLIEIPIRFPFNSVDHNFHTTYQYYHGRRRACYGDGVTAKRKHPEGHENAGETYSEDCDPDSCEFYQNGKCKISGILTCLLPASKHFGGIYRFRTHGFYSVSGLLASLQYYSENTGGVLAGLPFRLIFMKKDTVDHGGVPVVAITMDRDLVKGMTEMRTLAIKEAEDQKRSGVDIKLIEQSAVDAGLLEDEEDPDVGEEFYPPQEGYTPPLRGTSGDELEGAISDSTTEAEHVDMTSPDQHESEHHPDEEEGGNPEREETDPATGKPHLF